MPKLRAGTEAVMSELTEFFAQILHTEQSLSSRNVKLRKRKWYINLSRAMLFTSVCSSR